MRTLGFLLAMQADGATAPAPALGGGFIDLIRQSSAVSQFVLAVLVIFSIVSWGIILYKLWSFNRIQRAERALHRDLPTQHQVLRSAGGLPVAERQPARGNFPRGLRRAESATSPARRRRQILPAARRRRRARAVLKSLVAVDRALMRASNVEVNKLEKRITFLATTAAVTPFIGLFGTVLGIIGRSRASARTGRRASTSSRPASPMR